MEPSSDSNFENSPYPVIMTFLTALLKIMLPPQINYCLGSFMLNFQLQFDARSSAMQAPLSSGFIMLVVRTPEENRPFQILWASEF